MLELHLQNQKEVLNWLTGQLVPWKVPSTSNVISLTRALFHIACAICGGSFHYLFSYQMLHNGPKCSWSQHGFWDVATKLPSAQQKRMYDLVAQNRYNILLGAHVMCCLMLSFAVLNEGTCEVANAKMPQGTLLQICFVSNRLCTTPGCILNSRTSPQRIHD